MTLDRVDDWVKENTKENKANAANSVRRILFSYLLRPADSSNVENIHCKTNP